MNGKRPAPWTFLRRTVVGFVRSRRGGAMLVGGVFVLLTMALAGERMSNYAWREAQFEELQSGLRAAVASAAPLLGVLGTPSAAAAKRDIKKRVADFVTALLPGVNVAPAGVKVKYDRSTGVTTITVGGQRVFDGIWNVGDEVTAFESDVRVRYRRDRFEIATALDVSPSMACGFGWGCPAVPPGGESRMDALKSAMDAVADTMAVTAATRSGTLMVSMVPFAGAVNVADTGGTGRTAAKERYVRMLVGPHRSTPRMLQKARRLRDAGTGGHWVDTFHHYGTSAGPGLLARQYLPDSVLENRDWDLRQTGVTLDVSGQVPSLGNWQVDGADFWNGCVMARWGAYWEETARPPGWTVGAAGNWPASQEVLKWSPEAADLSASTPLHLSDAPPDRRQPNTLFTAYSSPDARIGGGADARLQTVMARLLGAPDSATGWRAGIYQDIMIDIGEPWRGDPLDILPTLGRPNDWSLANGGGDAMCPPSPIVPLTEDVATMRTAVDGLSALDVGPGRDGGATLLPLGLAWGLRTLSPLWRDVWEVADGRGAARPGVSCAPGEEQDCDASLTKAIVIVTDGRNNAGQLLQGDLRSELGPWHEWWLDSPACGANPVSFDMGGYFAAAGETRPAQFNGLFGNAVVDSDGRFTEAGRFSLVDALLRYGDPAADPPERRNALEDRLKAADLTPWQVFRGLDAAAADFLVDPDNGMGLDGRPGLNGRHFCHWSSPFSAYGRTGDSVYVGEHAGALVPPVRGVAPFAANDRGSPGSTRPRFDVQLFNWTLEACEIAGQRGVRIFIILINPTAAVPNQLSFCIARAGGTRGEDVFVVRNADELRATFAEIFAIEQNLRFL